MPQAAPAAPYSLRLNSQLVILDVVVTDQKGSLVTDLPSADFTVLENNVAQPIVSFDPPAAAAAGDPALDSTATVDKLAPQITEDILVLDEITTTFADEAFTRYAIQKYLATQGDVLAEPTMLLAVSLDHQTLLSDYTTSRSKLLEALNAHHFRSDTQRINPKYQGEQATAALLTLAGLAEASAGHEGHKNIVWIGRGFPDLKWDQWPAPASKEIREDIRACTTRLLDSRVTLYTVDPAGSDTVPLITHTDDPDLFVNYGIVSGTIATAYGGQEDFEAIHGRGGVEKALSQIVSFGRNFYTIAYKPTAPVSAASSYRHIQILLKDRTLTASAPEGYFRGDASTADTARRQASLDLAVASDGLIVYDGLPVTLERVVGAAGKFRISVPADRLGWLPAGDKGLPAGDNKLPSGDNKLPAGEPEAGDLTLLVSTDLTLLVSTYDERGKLVHRDGRVLHLTRPPMPPGQNTRPPVRLITSIATEAPVTRVRVLVRSENNGRIGTANYFVDRRKTSDAPAPSPAPAASR
jgi:VWFA-related protein